MPKVGRRACEMARRPNKEILADAKAGIELFAKWLRQYEQVPGISELAQHMASPENTGSVPRHLRYPYFHPSHPFFPEAMARGRDSAIFRLWGKAKVVYAMDDDLLGYLSESSVSSIPTEILKGLPHANPYVLLPAPDLSDPETEYYRTHIGVPWGAFVFGRYRNGELLCATNDERREDLGLMFLGFIENDEETALQTLRCTIPLRERMLTVESVVSKTIEGFTFNEHLQEEERTKFEAWLRKYVALVFNSLVYVCTDQPDIESYRPGVNKVGKVKKSAQRQQRRPRPSDITEVVQLGFRMGPALNEARRRREHEQAQQSATGTGIRQPPHQRCGTYRTYWTGRGRQIPRLRWVAPYWVSQDLLGDEAPQTAVVRRVKKRP
jgi:hypothetical protein